MNVGEPVPHGRSAAEWSSLVAAGTRFLLDEARLQRSTSYTEMNSVLRQRTEARPFDFEMASERAALGDLLGQIATEQLPVSGHLVSAIVIYLNENDAGSGFYRLAEHLDLLAPGASPRRKEEFWASEVRAVHEYYKPVRRR